MVLGSRFNIKFSLFFIQLDDDFWCFFLHRTTLATVLQQLRSTMLFMKAGSVQMTLTHLGRLFYTPSFRVPGTRAVCRC